MSVAVALFTADLRVHDHPVLRGAPDAADHGCLSAAELVHRARSRGGPDANAFVRQIAWRDFHRQMLANRPELAREDHRLRGDRWGADDTEFAAWRDGCTGNPVVDAAMRQLAREGWRHNRGRLITASFLTKTLYADWRVGARHFLADNQLNWQWVAGTGAATRPNQMLNPLLQARHFDPRGDYVRRWVVHLPWRLPAAERRRLDYPEPIVDLSERAVRFRRARRAR